MKNVLFNADHPADPTYPKYVCVITQYVAKLNAHKVKNLMKAYQNANTEVQKASSSGFKFRLADEKDAVELTGYGHNGMTPFYMKNDSLLIILAEGIAKLEPKYFFLGAGKVNLKIGISVEEFKKYFGEKRVLVRDVY